MFELPEAKRVRREDLGDPDDSGANGDGALGHDEAMQARVNAQIAAALGLDDDDDGNDDEPLEDNSESHAQDTDAVDVDDNGEHDTEQGYEFNLFSTASAGGPAGPAKVILEDENADLGDGAFVRPRPLSHYAAKTPSAKQKEQYSYAAVTADDIVQWSAQPSWGMAMPWKVVSISATRKAKPGDKSVDILMENIDEAAKRKRPGKKQRILLRQRKKTKAQAAEDAAKKEMEKEEHIKDKKKRLNRIKKLRKRAKGKEKKLANGDEADAADVASDSDGDE
ncbi:hypothetical protein LMH87_004431 [Akanthomyces muscarius]|uniref:Uncharacterized protein n=1 Tax=Akanthomyces muscarius TaxID=2231603 RepID=A0A9W8Q5C0_AKAMU|nr:hypothetical protein LMH87_004431 [Akanthomyces muscarius]KAJ4145584.1 hypothetical protein LMH87_004431 [Akanthomyces muscarius]